MDTVRNGEVIQPGGTCFNQLAFYLTQSSLAVFTDVYVYLTTTTVYQGCVYLQWILHSTSSALHETIANSFPGVLVD